MAKSNIKKVCVGNIEFKFSNRDIEAMIKSTAKRVFENNENQMFKYIQIIRTLQRKVERLEIKLAKIEMGKVK